jgi:drug/metabolite transporter (DMT)-like permease
VALDRGKQLAKPQSMNLLDVLSFGNLPRFSGTLLSHPILVLQYLSNAALALTSVASTTILSSTAGLFTLLFGVLLGQESLNLAKVVAVLVSITGVAMTTLGKTWSTNDTSDSLNE